MASHGYIDDRADDTDDPQSQKPVIDEADDDGLPEDEAELSDIDSSSNEDGSDEGEVSFCTK